jgi:chlorosome envelope protein I
MSVVLAKLYGVDRDLETRLKARGIKDSEDLLLRYRKCGGANLLAMELELDEETTMCLINRAQLARIRGIGEAYTMLLEAAGVKTVQDLAVRSPEQLRNQFEQINETARIVGRVPALPMVNGWVVKAQKAPQI